MITAGLAPGCSAAAHRLLAVAVSGRASEPLSWSPLAMTLAIALPIALLTVLIIWACRRHFLLVGVFAALAAYAVHPPSVVILAPLLLTSRPAQRGLQQPVLMTIAAMLAIAIWLITPACAVAERPDAFRLAAEVVVILGSAVGIIGALLAVAEIVRGPRSRETGAAMAIVVLSVLATFLVPAYDRRITLVPAIVACWWLAARVALRFVSDTRSMTTRLAMLVVFALVPAVTAVRVTAQAPRRSIRTSWSKLTAALDRLPRPAGIVMSDAALAPWIAAWRGGLADGAGSLTILPPGSPALTRALSTRAVFAWTHDVEQLSKAGLVLGPLRPPEDGDEPTLWRVLDEVACVPLGPSWSDVTALAGDGQLAIQLSGTVADPVQAVIYSATPAPVPADARVLVDQAVAPGGHGALLEKFDVARSEDRARLIALARSDRLDETSWLAGSGVVSRVTIDLDDGMAAAPGLTFAVAPSRMMARVSRPPWWPSAVAACRSTWSLVVVGYPEAPGEVAFDLLGHAWAQRGWHGPEKEGDVVFRWTSDRQAEVRFIAVAPVALTIALDLMPILGPARDQLDVLLNGRPLARDAGRDQWRAPQEAVVRGANTLTLAAPVVPGPPGDSRRLGLKVRAIVLRR